MKRRWIYLIVLFLSSLVYSANIDDYFIGDDFDLIASFYGKPPSYICKLLYHNESDYVWESFGITPDSGRGYLRPLKIWSLMLDFALWETNSFGFHITSTLFFIFDILLLFLILSLFFEGKPWFPFFAAMTAAIHPVFSESVPFITAREELMAVFFTLLTFYSFLRYRLYNCSKVPVYMFYLCALLTKEITISVPGLLVAYDLVMCRRAVGLKAQLTDLIKTYLPFVWILILYFTLRLIAFGNFMSGEGEGGFLSIKVFLQFYIRFFNSLFGEHLFFFHNRDFIKIGVISLVVFAILLILFKRKYFEREYFLTLLFFGPLWYVCSTVILNGVYFTPRHNIMPTIGLIIFCTFLLEGLLKLLAIKKEAVCTILLLCIISPFFLPTTIKNSLEFSNAADVVKHIRTEIELKTQHLPPGSSILLTNVPQQDGPPHFFGWGLLSALKKPFTKSDLAAQSTVINFKNIKINNYRTKIPQKYDLILTLSPPKKASNCINGAKTIF